MGNSLTSTQDTELIFPVNMMKSFLALAFFGLAAAQLGGLQGVLQNIRDQLAQSNNNDDTVDTIHGWRLEDHQTADDHLLLFINDSPDSRYCYVIKVATSWEPLLQDQENVFRISEEIYALINDPNHRERPLRPGDLAEDYQDFDAARECRGHATY